MPTDIEEAIARGHPAANVFPMLSDAELWDLADDIGKHGLKEPIEICEGLILDGRNRWVACVRAGVSPRTLLWDGPSPMAHVISKNLKRRHLDPSQRAAAAAEALPVFEAEAKERERMGKEKIPYPEAKGPARDFAAEQFDVNPRYVQDAKRLRDDDPETFARVKAGDVSISDAKRASPAFVMPEREEASPEERAYYAISRVRAVASLEPAAVAGFCADASLSVESFRRLEEWLARFTAALAVEAQAPLRVVR